MRKLIMKMSITIDGFVADLNGKADWIFKSSDETSRAWSLERQSLILNTLISCPLLCYRIRTKLPLSVITFPFISFPRAIHTNTPVFCKIPPRVPSQPSFSR